MKDSDANRPDLPRRPGGERAGRDGWKKQEEFWRKYANALEAAGLPKKKHPYYQRECERFIQWIQPRRLKEMTADAIQGYVHSISATNLPLWRVEQAERALRILYRDVLRLDWAREWTVQATNVPAPDSETIERGIERFWAQRGERDLYQNMRGKFRDSIEKMLKVLRVRHYSYRTEEAYLGWTLRFLAESGKQEPSALAGEDIATFLERLALKGKVAASTQNQAFNGLVFFFRFGLDRRDEVIGRFEKAKRERRLPTHLTRGEMELLGHKDVSTTMIYTHVLNRPGIGARSPLDG